MKLFKKFIESEFIKIKYARGKSDIDGREFHTFNEIILFMDGKGTFISDKIHIELKPGLIIVIPRESYHQFLISGNKEDYHRCVIHFDNLPLKNNEIFVAYTNSATNYLFNKIIKLAENGSADENLLLSSVTLLLDEISHSKSNNALYDNEKNLCSDCVELIDKNLCNRISVSGLAKILNVSESGIAHVFKKEMNISLYQYILKKKLMLAHRKISEGTPATAAALECGFSDYSGFYRHYKKMFNHPPSASKNKIDKSRI